MDIGQKIKNARINKGLTQEELGKIIGVQKSAIAKYENGRVVNIKRSSLQKIAKALDLRPSELIFDEKIKAEPIGTGQLHAEMVMDEDFAELFEDYKKLDGTQRKIVADLVHNLAEAKKEA